MLQIAQCSGSRFLAVTSTALRTATQKIQVPALGYTIGPYAYFVKENFAKEKQANQNGSASDVLKNISAMWKKLSEDQKQVYVQKSTTYREEKIRDYQLLSSEEQKKEVEKAAELMQSASSDDSWENLAMPYESFDIVLTDINEEKLLGVGVANDVAHLSPGTFSLPAFPVNGRIHSLNIRYMVPLVCQRAGKPDSSICNIWFLVDTGSPFTCLTEKSIEALFGEGNATNSLYNLAIQDQKSRIECHVSQKHFKEVNILGADAMRKLKLSIVVDWEDHTFKLCKQ